MAPQPKATQSSEVIILLISGSCCAPQLAVLDQQAQQIIHQALEETGITGQVRTLAISSALQGGIPAEILKQLQASLQPANLMRLPALFINGKLISFGMPELNQIKSALLLTQSETNTQEGN